MKSRICPSCGATVQMGEWYLCPHGWPHGSLSPRPVHRSETAVVYRNPRTGAIRYPGRNDAPMPERYRQQGYQMEALDTLPKLDQFCKERGLVNEKANFDSNGRADAE